MDTCLAVSEGTSVAIIGELRSALHHEMQARSSEAIASLAQGRRLSTVGSRSLWSFSTEPGDADDIPLDTPAKLTDSSGCTTDAEALAVGDASVVLSLPAGFTGDDPWVLTYNARFVNQRLSERLDELMRNGDCNEDLLAELVRGDGLSTDDAGGSTLDTAGEPADDQALAARRAVQPGVRFTWGPPGTGKTRVLSMAVAQAVTEGHRVLVLAQQSAAVEEALEDIAEELGAHHPDLLDGGVVRVGTPWRVSEATGTSFLPSEIAGRRNRALADRVTALTEAQRRLGKVARLGAGNVALDAQIEQTRAELRETSFKLGKLARQVVEDATVVATTLSRAVIDDQVWALPFDVILIDDASMAPLPIVAALVLRGARTVSFFGDFRHLPPIAGSDHATVRPGFASDVFEYAGVIERYEQGIADPRLHTLRTQFRMGERICSVLNELAYDGWVRTAPQARDEATRSAQRCIGAGEEVVIVDTSGIGVSCGIDATKDSRSRINPCHALLAASIAECLVADGFATVGVISPYRAQAHLLATLTRTIDGAMAGTIGHFGSSVCEAVVLDLTDAAPMQGPSMLTGNDADLARRLFSVAVSRARHKLVVIADTAFIEGVMDQAAIPQRLLDAMVGSGAARVEGSWVTERLIAADADAPTRHDAAGRSEPRPVWFANWSAALDDPSAAAAAAGSIEANVAGDEALACWSADPKRSVAGRAPTVLRGNGSMTHRLDRSGSNPSSQTPGGTPWVMIDERAVAIGATKGDGPVALVDDPVFAAAFRRVAAPQLG